MQIDMPPRRPRGESIIPMINVVFLLLIFFLLTAQITQPTPFPLTPPDSASDIPSQNRDVLYISAEGELVYNEARGDAVWPEISKREALEALEIRADAATPAVKVAQVLKRFQSIDDGGANLVVSGR